MEARVALDLSLDGLNEAYRSATAERQRVSDSYGVAACANVAGVCLDLTAPQLMEVRNVFARVLLGAASEREAQEYLEEKNIPNPEKITASMVKGFSILVEDWS